MVILAPPNTVAHLLGLRLVVMMTLLHHVHGGNCLEVEAVRACAEGFSALIVRWIRRRSGHAPECLAGPFPLSPSTFGATPPSRGQC